MSRPIREKHCDRCEQTSPVLYRVQPDDSAQWIFVCPACWATVSQNPFYVYGGTWKAKKKG